MIRHAADDIPDYQIITHIRTLIDVAGRRPHLAPSLRQLLAGSLHDLKIEALCRGNLATRYTPEMIMDLCAPDAADLAEDRATGERA